MILRKDFKFVTKIVPGSSEFAHQCRFFECLALNAAFDKSLKFLSSPLIFAIKNEEKSGSVVVGTRQKMAGCKAGVADIFCAIPFNGYHGLFIEMKRPGGKQSEKQEEFELLIIEKYYKYKLCFNWEEAIDALEKYLSY